MSTSNLKYNGFYQKQALVALSLVLIAGAYISALNHENKYWHEREQSEMLRDGAFHSEH